MKSNYYRLKDGKTIMLIEERLGFKDLTCAECRKTIKKTDPISVQVDRQGETIYRCKNCFKKYIVKNKEQDSHEQEGGST